MREAIHAPPKAKRLSREEAQALAKVSGKTAPLFAEYALEPVRFALEIFCLKLCRAQRRILTAIARKDRVAIRSGQKTGKTTALVIAALWWAATRARGRVVLTATTGHQVRKVLWKELQRIAYLRRPDGRSIVDVLGVTPALQPSTGMQWPDGREIVGWSADDPNAVQGISGPEMLFVIDEGTGVLDPIFEAFEGNTAGGGKILTASNPIENVGWFYEAFHSRSEFWETLHESSEDSPNVTGAEDPIPGLAGREWVAQRREEHGVESAWYQNRVLGNFYGATTNTIVGLTALADSHTRWTAHAGLPRTERLELGVDVARFGDDDTAIAPRRGPRIYELETVHGYDGNQVAGKILEVARRMRRDRDERVVVKIDAAGGYGAGPADILRANHDKELQIVEVNAGTKADDEEHYTNLRAQLHFSVREYLKDGGELPPDKKLDVELLAPTYTFDARGRYLVEPKDKIKKRIQRSPDRADAVALAIYGTRSDDDRPRIVPGTGSRWGSDDRGFG